MRGGRQHPCCTACILCIASAPSNKHNWQGRPRAAPQRHEPLAPSTILAQHVSSQAKSQGRQRKGPAVLNGQPTAT